MKLVMVLALGFLAGCATPDRMSPVTGQTTRQFEAPLSRVKPAFISTVSSMGMGISSLEVRDGREVIRARKTGSEVEIELDPVSRTATRARVAARSGGMFYDNDTASRVMRQAEKLLGGR
jgi:hypothetical protein